MMEEISIKHVRVSKALYDQHYNNSTMTKRKR